MPLPKPPRQQRELRFLLLQLDAQCVHNLCDACDGSLCTTCNLGQQNLAGFQVSVALDVVLGKSGTFVVTVLHNQLGG